MTNSDMGHQNLPYTLTRAAQDGPIIVSSPHSGQDYPHDFVSASILDAHQLRQSEDMYVDELFVDAPSAGACLLTARYPRAFVDLNRSIHEIDRHLVDGDYPAHRDQSLPRVQAGLGIIPRIVAEDTPIYSDTLSSDIVEERINAIYRPFHACLQRQLAHAHKNFGFAVLIDAHSMPAQAGRAIAPSNRSAALDIVIGTYHDAACAPAISELIGKFLIAAGYTVSYNRPYAGGFITTHYGQPSAGHHAVQIEINRSLYMNEENYEKTANFEVLRKDLGDMIARLHHHLMNDSELAIAQDARKAAE